MVPHLITKRQFEIVLGKQSSLVDRLIWAAEHRPELRWLDIYRFGSRGRETLIWRDSADRACKRILSDGEFPPEVPVGHDRLGNKLDYQPKIMGHRPATHFEGQLKTLYPITIEGIRPYLITKRDLTTVLGNQTTVVTRLLWAARNRPELDWLEIDRWGEKGRETLITTKSADRACGRILLVGEMPPELPVDD